MNAEEQRLEALSAALDGAEVSYVVQPQDEPRLAEYRRMGEMLRALPDPELHPAFLTRVLANTVEAPPPHTAFVWWRWAGLGGTLAAAALALFLALGDNSAAPPAPSPVASPAVALLDADLSEEEEVVEAMAALLDEGVVLELGGIDDPDPLAEDLAPQLQGAPLPAQWAERISEEVYAALADPYWLAPEAPLTGAAPGFLPEIYDMDAVEREAFEALLADYGKQG